MTALSPSPEAKATGKFATTPIAMLAAAAKHVAANSARCYKPKMGLFFFQTSQPTERSHSPIIDE